MAIFTAIGTALAATFFAGSAIAATVIATGLSLAASFALSYAVKALSGKPAQKAAEHFGVQTQIAGGGAVPRSFGFGRHLTAGSLVYANTWSNGTQTPNAMLSQVIALSDMPGEQLIALWVNGSKVTLPLNAALYSNFGTDLGYQVPEYVKLLDGESSPTPHLFVKYYDGTQTAADGALVNALSSSARPYTGTRVGTGICYAVVHTLINDTLWNGIPTFKFEMSGIPLYDPSKDSTVGGSGAHRFDEPATWGGDGDDYPVVQAYAILRGISYGASWLYGLQNIAAARLPVSNWIAQIGKCRTAVLGDAGPEPTYRTGLQINVDAQPANALEALMTGCQGKISEVGGFYKCHVGAPDSTSFSFADADIIATESQAFRPFFALSDSVNGIQATYPDPAQGWNTATAPAYYRTDLEARDGNRRLMANPAFDAVPYPEQVQRLQKSAVEEGQRARGHTIVLPPAYWTVEPGDVGEWTSARNGYAAKQFRVDAGTDKANLDVVLVLTEVDPADYDWDTATDFTPVTGGATISNPPAPQGIAGFDAQPYILVDDSGLVRRPAILITWDGSQPGVSAVQYEVRRALDAAHVARGRSDRVTAGNLIITQSILPAMAYQVRGAFVPSAPRDMLWSAWIDVTAPDVRLSIADFEAAIKAQVTTLLDFLNDKVDEATQLIASISANQDARNWLDKKEARSQLDAVAGTAKASIATLQQAMADDQAALALFQTEVSATFGPSFSTVSTVSAAVATLEGYAAASYAVTLDVNGYATGFELVNGGAGVSEFTVTADKFLIAAPGVSGGDPVPIFTVGNVSGSPKIAFRGDMYADGSITATMINVAVLSAITANIGTVTAGKIQSPSGNFVIDADNERIEIWS
ncbi:MULTISPECIES: phage tail protein [unclassified Bradyrhizobium]|uniref:phage tail protein n=1 Tax=unclassified Bradyrhizobium TaxID=2631580 RepID=UPI00211DE9B5|nr:MULTISPECIES: phage tail protein [unclassified Bradyrhizobium]MDD1534555.1 phage tail protein [Bradyrhizobium sp. WBOS8]MDD1581419.1 phage tail protein [Bradyrhizobium sp. WBOS4]UUO49709.1 phage tail protein [Bradyrhizobium sp. WBOS04]UUO58474.1 phage tail protein [Bradyrhizobium sp. WBOS08]